MFAVFGDARGSGILIAAFSGAVTAALTIALVITGIRYWCQQRNGFTLLEVGAFIACPGTVQFLAAESGRLDQIGYLALLGSLFALLRCRRSLQWPLVSATAVVLCLIHEAFVVMLAPMLLATVLASRMSDTHNWREISYLVAHGTLALVPAIAMAALLTSSGRLDYDTQLIEVVRRLTEVADFTISPTAIMVQFRSFSQNALYTHSFWLEPSRVPALATAAMALLPSALVALRVALHSLQPESSAQSRRRLSPLAWAALVCCLAPLTLLLQGTDLSRWAAAAVLNLFIVGMVGIRPGSGIANHSINPRTHSSNVLLWCVIAYSLAVGPISVVAGPYSLMRLGEAIRVLAAGI